MSDAATPPWVVKEHKDIGYHVRMRPGVVCEPAYVVEYEVRRYTNDTDLVEITTGAPIISPNPDDVKPEFTGSIKWDGCAHHNLGYQHFCGGKRGGVQEFCTLLGRLYDQALELMPEHEEWLK